MIINKKNKIDPEVDIKLTNVSKYFKINHENSSTFKTAFLRFLRKGKNGSTILKVVDNVSFEIRKGDMIGIIGKNGSGKSTLLKLIAGIFSPDSGEIYTKGRIVPFLELGVGFHPELTARENIYLNGTILGMTRKEITDKFDEIIAFSELKEFVDTPLKNFSTGMQVRLAFSVAIKAKGDIFILDEILAVGDMAFQEKSLNVFEDFIRQGKTIIYVSHSIDSIRKYCNKVIWMNDKKVRYEDINSGITEDYVKSIQV